MAPSGGTRWWLASCVAHGAVLAVLSALPSSSRAPPPPVWRVTEISVEPPPAPPPEPPPAAPEVPPPAPTPTAPSPPAARPVARAARVVAPPPAPTAPPPTAPPAPAPPTPPTPPAPPTPPTPPAPPPTLRATDLLRPSATNLALPGAEAPAPAPNGRASLFEGSTGTTEARARAATQGFVREALASTMVREAPGVRTYLWNVRRRVAEAWRPGAARVPNLADTLMAGFIAPERALRIFGERMIRRQRQVLEAPAPRLGGAADTLEAMGGAAGNGPLANRPSMATNAGDESWRRNVRTTRVEVLVEQDPTGRVLDVRVLHGSGIPAFDRAAVEAVRSGLADEDPTPLPGGRRSRWSFTVVATRRLFTPSVGGAFDESRGWFRIEVPGQVTLRSRVQMEASAPLDRDDVTRAAP